MSTQLYEPVPVFETSLIQQKIQIARSEARSLYYEVENIRKTIQDSTLSEMSKNIAKLPTNNDLKLYNTLKGHQDKIAQVRWSKDSSKLLSASQDGYMIIWDPVSGLKKQALTLENPWVLTCAYSPNGKLIASGGLDNACTIYKIKQDPFDDISNSSSSKVGSSDESYPMYGNFYHNVKSIFKSHTAYISDCDFIDDNTIVTGSGDMSCCLWDITKGEKIRDFVDHLGDVLCLSVNSNNSTSNSDHIFISGSSDGYAKVWDLRQKSPAQNFFISNSDINCIKQSHDGNSFITGSDDGMIRYLDLRSDCEIDNYSLQGKMKSYNSQIFDSRSYSNADDKFIPSSEQSPTSFYNKSSLNDRPGSVLSTYDTPGVISLDFSNSGRLIYSCYSNYGCMIWDTFKNEIIGSVGANTHSNIINQVKVSPDGIGLCTASWDSTIKIWSV